MGGRSRVAAQMLAGQGFDKIYNVAGGFKAWDQKAAYGGEELGLDLFSGDETPEQTLIVAYSLEAGLRDFYISMLPRVKNSDAKNLFQMLSGIEVKHQDRIFDEYVKLSQTSLSREEFENNIVIKAVEGGLTTEEYLKLFNPDLESANEIADLAMSIEAQALDLYLRASRKSRDSQTRQVLIQIAEEEKAHLKQLGKLIDTIATK